MNDRPTLLRNDTPRANHWITLRLVGTKSNRDGIGARVTRARRADGVRRTEVRGDGSYLSHSDVRAHFGLGSARRVRSRRDPLAERTGGDGVGRGGRSFLRRARGLRPHAGHGACVCPSPVSRASRSSSARAANVW